MYYVIIKDNIYYGCFVHNHISMNKLLIVFMDLAIRGMLERLMNNTGLAVCVQKIGTSNISGLAICVKKSGT